MGNVRQKAELVAYDTGTGHTYIGIEGLMEGMRHFTDVTMVRTVELLDGEGYCLNARALYEKDQVKIPSTTISMPDSRSAGVIAKHVLDDTI